jgi:hypothetical protein
MASTDLPSAIALKSICEAIAATNGGLPVVYGRW